MAVDENPSAVTVCVVGAGPRGVAVVERICANLRALGDAAPRVVVHLVDAVGDGGGRVWRTTQPRELLMNTVACQVTMFTDETVHCAGPVAPGPSLYDWARFVTEGIDDYPEAVRAEAAALGPDSYPSRSFYGHYVGWVLRGLISTAPASLSVRTVRATAVALDDDADGTQVLTLDNGDRLRGLDSVVLAQGHVDREPIGPESALIGFAARAGLRYIPPHNPADVDLSGIKPGEAVALRGMGLNFFDYMALLTTGRGGRYTETAEGLAYQPSGREPLLYTGSRRGLPYHARGENQKGVAGRHEPMFLTEERVERFRAGPPVHFRRDLWPLITSEVRLAYHAAIIAERDGRWMARAFTLEYVDVATTDRATAVESRLLDRYGVARSERWDWDRVVRPWGERTFSSHADYQAWLLTYLREDVAQAELGNVRGPLKAAMDVLRDLRNEIRLVVDHRGLAGTSYRDELNRWYGPLNAFLSIGPPVRRIREMIALVEAGVLTVLAPGVQARPAPGGTEFLVGANTVPDTVTVTSLIEARLPEPHLEHTTDPLLRYLWITGQCAPYHIPDDPDTPSAGFDTGAIAVTTRPYHLVDATGTAHPHRFAFGVPTESVHWLTAAGIRPGSNSVILTDADAIARAALGLTDESAVDSTPAPAARLTR
ncbi:FAD/NAD(P)-binding protein [Actinokineospora terrae]|uniref:FAD-NAD(P)-binding n=1 Tax=Actinokineospora terrae TaxID=155974 RepID=A0A1H9WI75_9PSEU|nr:FAD/NAD(P)-binding protein [Actinokineospora terrae]SES33626.1 FAD-NAD(P)-binding [Actinokineospora terrae]